MQLLFKEKNIVDTFSDITLIGIWVCFVRLINISISHFSSIMQWSVIEFANVTLASIGICNLNSKASLSFSLPFCYGGGGWSWPHFGHHEHVQVGHPFLDSSFLSTQSWFSESSFSSSDIHGILQFCRWNGNAFVALTTMDMEDKHVRLLCRSHDCKLVIYKKLDLLS